METLNSSAVEQDGPTPGSENSPEAQQDGAGDRTQKRVDDLMGLANRRLTAQQRAEAERDAAKAEVEALRASMDADWEAERASYWQQAPPVMTEIADAAPAEGESEGEDENDEPYVPPPRIDPNMAPRRSPQPVMAGGEPPLDAVRAEFARASEAENERLKALRDWP